MNEKPLVLLPLFFCSAILLLSCSDKNKSVNDYSSTPKVVKTQNVSVFNVSVERHVTGRLQASQSTSLSFEVNGVISKVMVNLGESFKKDSLLAQLDPKRYLLALEQQTSMLDEAIASRFEAKQTLDRNVALKAQNLISQAQLENAQAAFTIANERVNSAASAQGIAKQNLNDTKLYAPYDGTISERFVEPGQLISTQTSIFTIQGDDNLEVVATVPESVVARIALGEQVQVVIPALNNLSQSPLKHLATISEIGTKASVANAFPITVSLNQSHQRLLPGMSAELILPLLNLAINKPLDIFTPASSPVETLYQIPISAIATNSQGQYVVIVVNQDNQYKAQIAPITIVQTLPKEVIAIFDTPSKLPNINKQNSTSEANKTFVVITAGVEFIDDGQVVMPLTKSQQIYNQ
jgi:RND family efflux transporter MFP subunit